MLVFRASSPSAEDLRVRDKVVDAIAYSSIISCIMVIITAVLLSRHPLSKPKTDRVSFRIMIYALCASNVYTIAAILANRASGSTVCRVAASFVIVGLHLSSFLFFCIGLNLQLVMIHGVDGTRAEKYYVWGSLSLAIVLGILTYASNQLVYNPTQSVCYYYDPNPTRGLLWRIGTQLFWSYLTMVGEIITFVSVVVYMVRVKVFSSGPSREATSTSTSTGSQGLSASRQYRKPLGPRQYRNVVLRIALYPLSSLLTTGVTAVGTMTSPSQIQPSWIVMSALLAALMFRGMVYASVAAADPAITQGLKTLFRHYVRKQTTSQSSNGVGIFVVRSVVANRRPRADDIELQEFPNESENKRGEHCTRYNESTSSIARPKSAVIASHSEVQSGTSSSYTSFVNVANEHESQTDVNLQVQYSFAQLRQL